MSTFCTKTHGPAFDHRVVDICPECNAVSQYIYPDWICNACDAPMEGAQEIPNDIALAHDAWMLQRDQDIKDHQLLQERVPEYTGHRTSGGPTFGSIGHEVFQLDPQIPDRVAHSMSDMDAIYKKYGLDKDTHTWKKGKEPASEYRRRNNGRLRDDRD